MSTQHTPEAQDQRSVLSTRFDPRGGWEAATPARRHLAGLGALYLGVWAILSYAAVTASQLPGEAAALVLAGVPGMYHLARVLRPHLPDASMLDKARHWVAAIGSASVAPLVMTILWGVLLQEEPGTSNADVFIWYLLLAWVGITISVPWALISTLVRYAARR